MNESTIDICIRYTPYRKIKKVKRESLCFLLYGTLGLGSGSERRELRTRSEYHLRKPSIIISPTQSGATASLPEYMF